jgi:hypothetical protein
MKLNIWQKALLQDYSDGEFIHLASQNEIEDPMKLGDTLLSFMLLELEAQENCENADDGINRLKRAHTDIEVALVACLRVQEELTKKLDTAQPHFV